MELRFSRFTLVVGIGVTLAVVLLFLQLNIFGLNQGKDSLKGYLNIVCTKRGKKTSFKVWVTLVVGVTLADGVTLVGTTTPWQG